MLNLHARGLNRVLNPVVGGVLQGVGNDVAHVLVHQPV
jgi:hypothetical protein